MLCIYQRARLHGIIGRIVQPLRSALKEPKRLNNSSLCIEKCSLEGLRTLELRTRWASSASGVNRQWLGFLKAVIPFSEGCVALCCLGHRQCWPLPQAARLPHFVPFDSTSSVAPFYGHSTGKPRPLRPPPLPCPSVVLPMPDYTVAAFQRWNHRCVKTRLPHCLGTAAAI